MIDRLVPEKSDRMGLPGSVDTRAIPIWNASPTAFNEWVAGGRGER
jgi:hypothetical protein